MECSNEHVEATKVNKVELCKINTVRKHKRVLLPHELLGTKGLKLENCGKDDQEVISVSWCSIEVQNGSIISKGDKVNKQSIKAWNKFIQWLRHKKVRKIRDFKVVSQQKLQYDDNADKFYITREHNEHDEHAHDEINLRRKVCKHNCKKQQLGLNCYGTIGVFKN